MSIRNVIKFSYFLIVLLFSFNIAVDRAFAALSVTASNAIVGQSTTFGLSGLPSGKSASVQFLLVRDDGGQFYVPKNPIVTNGSSTTLSADYTFVDAQVGNWTVAAVVVIDGKTSSSSPKTFKVEKASTSCASGFCMSLSKTFGNTGTQFDVYVIPLRSGVQTISVSKAGRSDLVYDHFALKEDNPNHRYLASLRPTDVGCYTVRLDNTSISSNTVYFEISQDGVKHCDNGKPIGGANDPSKTCLDQNGVYDGTTGCKGDICVTYADSSGAGATLDVNKNVNLTYAVCNLADAKKPPVCSSGKTLRHILAHGDFNLKDGTGTFSDEGAGANFNYSFKPDAVSQKNAYIAYFYCSATPAGGPNPGQELSTLAGGEIWASALFQKNTVGQQPGSEPGSANEPQPTQTQYTFEIQNPLGAYGSLEDLIDGIVGWLVKIAIPLAVIMILYAGILFLTAGQYPQNYEKAKTTLFYVVIGLTVIFIGKGFISLIKSILELSKGQ